MTRDELVAGLDTFLRTREVENDDWSQIYETL
jgi:hypothetical protein